MGKTKILYLITEIELGGAENLLLELSKGLSKEKFNISVGYLKGQGTLKEDFETAGIRVVDFKMRSKFDMFCLFKLAVFIRQEKFDIVHTHLINADIFGFFAAKIAGVNTIVSTKHNTDAFRRRKSFSMRLDSFVANRLSLNIAVSNSVRDFLIKYQRINPEKFKVVYNGINNAEFSPRKNKEDAKIDLGLNSKEYVVGVIGRFEEQKGHIYLIEAMQKIISEIENVRLVFLGQGSLKKSLQKRISFLNLGSKVTFLKMRSDVVNVLSALDIFILPSLWEGLGMAMLEAMAAGVPVIASDVDGIKEVIESDKTGILVPPADPGKIAEAVIELLKDEKRREYFSVMGQNSVQAGFNMFGFIKKIEKIYSQLRKAG